MIELAKGKYSIEVTDKSALISALEMVKQAVGLGEPDAQITAASVHARRAFELRLAELNRVRRYKEKTHCANTVGLFTTKLIVS